MQFNNFYKQSLKALLEKLFSSFAYKKNKVIFWFGPLILAIFFFLRLYNLTLIPVFVDEAIYIRWSQVMRAEPTLRFLPLSDGKQPLFMWLIIPFLKIFSDPLVAGRMVSILGGLGTLGGIFLLTLLLTRKTQAALLAAFLYTICPFTVFFDRMALVDSLLTCFGVWTLFLGVLLVQYQRLDLAMILGMVLGGALLTKSPAIFFAILLPATIVLSVKRPKFSLQLIKVVALWVVVYFFAFGIYNILRLGPNFHMIALRNKDYVFPFSHAIKNPLDPFQFHVKEIWEWFGTLLTWPVFLASFIGIWRGLRGENPPAGGQGGVRRGTLLLLTWVSFPLLAQAEYAKVFTPRYILFSVPLMLVFGGIGVYWIIAVFFKRKSFSYIVDEILIKKRLYRLYHTAVYDILMGIIILAVLIVGLLRFDFCLLTDPQKAPLPRKMKFGYLEEWTSGYGIKEAADYLKIEAQKGKILVGTEGFFGTLPDGLQIYLEKVPNITVIGVGYLTNQIPEKLVNALVDNRVFLVVNDFRLNLTEPELQRMKLIAAYSKAVRPDGKQEQLMLYEILE